MKLLILIMISSLTMSSTFARSKCVKEVEKGFSYFNDGADEFNDAEDSYTLAKEEMAKFWYQNEVICKHLVDTLYGYRRSAKAFDKSYATFRDAKRKCSGRNLTIAIKNEEIAGNNVKDLYNYMSLLDKHFEKYNCSK